MNDDQILRMKEKLVNAYRDQTGTYRDVLTIAAELLAKAEDRENRMAESVSHAKVFCTINPKWCARADGHSGPCIGTGNA